MGEVCNAFTLRGHHPKYITWQFLSSHGVVAYTCNTTPLEAKQKNCYDFEASLGYTVRHSVSKKKNKQKAKAKEGKERCLWFDKMIILSRP